MSKIREQFQAPPATPLEVSPTGDLRPYVIFTQLKAKGPYIYAGWLEAADDAMAIEFAKEHYGQDQECVNVMAIRRENITSSDGLYGSPSLEGGGPRNLGVGGARAAQPASGSFGDSTHPPTPSLEGRGEFQVFTQKKAGDLWITWETIEAATPQAAIDASRKTMKQAANAHAIWVVEVPNILSTHDDLIWRYTDQSYRLARGYGRDVRAKWIAIRDEKQLAEYEKDDLQEAF